tara:strand:+ start:57 stop:209 length:153 start_codon:yes stop_codon:yes gene_type:complete
VFVVLRSTNLNEFSGWENAFNQFFRKEGRNKKADSLTEPAFDMKSNECFN